MIESSYVKRVNTSIQKLDPLLKTLQVRASPPEGLVQAYLIHIGDRSDGNFKKILELKGIRRSDQPHLVELFQAHYRSSASASASVPTTMELVPHSTLLTPLNIPSLSTSSVAATSSSSASSTSAAAANLSNHVMASSLASLGTAAALSTPSLQARFDPVTLGSAIMSVARDGVDLFGGGGNVSSGHGISTSGHGSTGSSSSTMPFSASTTTSDSVDGGGTSTASTTINTTTTTTNQIQENLRNIGRFFKRDIGVGFAGRFGSGSSAAGSGGGVSNAGMGRGSRMSSEDAIR